MENYNHHSRWLFFGMVVSLTSSSDNIPFFYPTNPQGPSNGSGWVWTCMTPRGCFFSGSSRMKPLDWGENRILREMSQHLDCSCTPQVSWIYCWVVATQIFFQFSPRKLWENFHPFWLFQTGLVKNHQLAIGFWVQPGMPTWSWFLFAKTNSCNTYKLGNL